MSADRVPFALPDITEAEIEAVTGAIRSGWVTSGPEMVAFEREFAAHVGGQVEAVAVNSATAGLHLALEACGVGPGDEVIVPTWTFTATAEVVRYLGSTPVLVDVDPVTLNIDLPSVAEALTPATKAVIPVHLAGLGVDLKALRTIVGPASGSSRTQPTRCPQSPPVPGSVTASTPTSAVFSFYATKTITTGEGGMITTRDPSIAARARVMRLHGIDRNAFDRYRSDKPSWFYDVVAAGFKYNLADPAAAMGRVQFVGLRECTHGVRNLPSTTSTASRGWPSEPRRDRLSEIPTRGICSYFGSLPTHPLTETASSPLWPGRGWARVCTSYPCIDTQSGAHPWGSPPTRSRTHPSSSTRW